MKLKWEKSRLGTSCNCPLTISQLTVVSIMLFSPSGWCIRFGTRLKMLLVFDLDSSVKFHFLIMLSMTGTGVYAVRRD